MAKKAGQAKGNAEGTPSDSQTSDDASASFGDGGTDKKYLGGRFDSEEAATNHLDKLEESNKKNYAELQRMTAVINRLQGVASFLEIDPATGQYDLRPDIKEKIAGGGAGKDLAVDALKEELKNKFITKAGEDAPGALIDTIVEAITKIAKPMMGSVKAEIDGVQSNTMMALFLGEHPEYAPLVPYVQAWMNQNLTSKARNTVSIEDVFEVVKSNLKRSGRLDQTGYVEPEEGESKPKGKQKLTTGSGGKPLDETEADRAAEDKKIKEEIFRGASPLDKFFANTGKAKRDAEKENPHGHL